MKYARANVPAATRMLPNASSEIPRRKTKTCEANSNEAAEHKDSDQGIKHVGFGRSLPPRATCEDLVFWVGTSTFIKSTRENARGNTRATSER